MKFSFIALLGLLGLTVFAADPYPRQAHLDALHYQYAIALSDSSDRIVVEAALTFAFYEPQQQFFLDLHAPEADGRGMLVSRISSEGQDLHFRQQGERVEIQAPEGNPFQDTLIFEVNYSGKPADGLIISKNRFGDRTFFGDNWPDRAHHWLCLIDHPSDKATVEYRVTAPSAYAVVANGIKTEESPLGQGYTLTHWMETAPLSSKLMVIGVAPFARELAGMVDGKEVWTWVFPQNREAGFQDYAPAVDALAFYSELIAPYPYEKLANVQSKTRYGGMENAGCIFYSERSVSGEGRVEGLLAHEIAHQWFGDSAGEDDWHHVWLSEGFATYLTSVYFENKGGTEELEKRMISDRRRIIRAMDRRPGAVIDTTITNLMQLLSTYTYQKGAWVLHMLRFQLGEEIFWEGVREYYHRYQHSTALTSNLQEVMEEVSGRNLELFFSQWLYRKDLPRLSWSWSASEGGVTFTVQQLQEEPYVMPLELRLTDVAGKDYFRVVKVEEALEEFFIPLQTEIMEVHPDPETHLLFIPESASGQSGAGVF